MDWNTYRKDLDSAGFDPAFQQRVLRELDALADCRKEPIMKHAKHFARRGLIAAVVALAVTVTAFASFFTSWDAVRAHLGLGWEETIPEYVEYTGTASNNLSLISTLRTADGMTIYAEVSPIQIERADGNLATLNLDLDKEVLARVSHCNADTKVMSYDKETQTALLEITAVAFDVPFDTLDQVEITVEIRNHHATDTTYGPKVEATYGPMMVPVSEGSTRTAFFDIPFETALGQGHLTSAVMSTTTIRVYYSFPAYSAWENYVAYDAEKAEQQDEEWGSAFSDANHEYSHAWIKGAEAVLADASLEFADGSSVTVTNLEPAIFNVWYPYSYCDIEDFDCFSSMYYMEKPLDLRTVTGITIAGVTYPLNAE